MTKPRHSRNGAVSRETMKALLKSFGRSFSCAFLLLHFWMSCMVANKPRFLLTKQGSRKVLGPAHVDRIVDKFIEESEPVVARRVRKVVAHTHTL